jgi:cytochrome c oxidase subunit 3/cytochrome o ubiquinol oxidase subunit 3
MIPTTPMATASTTTAGEAPPWKLPSRARVGMFSLIAAESAIFVIFVVAYLFYAGKSLSGPTPSVLRVPIFFTVCLLSSSLTIHFAVSSLRKGRRGPFAAWWILTIVLGALFLAGTAFEWRHLIRDEGLTIDTNLFGTTYYSLVGLHAFHVTAGLLLLGVVALFALLRRVLQEHAERVDVLSLYWHFVDAVWVVVFTVVYLIGR